MSSSESGRRVSSCRIVVENQTASPPPSIPTTNMQRVGIKPLSGKPYFHAIILKTHLSPRFTLGPSSKICSKLPSGVAVPTVLNYHGKSWDMIYNGQKKAKQFDTFGWRKFAKDNCVKVGDACVFELMESKEKIIFEVQILRGDFPCEFPGINESEEEPIVLSELIGTGESEAPFVID